MAEVDTLMLSQEHSDIRREAGVNVATLQLENMKGFDRVNADVLKTGWNVTDRLNSTANDLSKQIDAVDDTVTAQLITIARESADNRAQITALGYQVRDGFVASDKSAEINALKTQIELSKQIRDENDKTRMLINEHRYADLNRYLIERNSELVDERHGRRYWRHHADLGQYQALNSQVQAFQSQLQETRQGMVNFGTMAGVGQSSTSNNVR